MLCRNCYKRNNLDEIQSVDIQLSIRMDLLDCYTHIHGYFYYSDTIIGDVTCYSILNSENKPEERIYLSVEDIITIATNTFNVCQHNNIIAVRSNQYMTIFQNELCERYPINVWNEYVSMLSRKGILLFEDRENAVSKLLVKMYVKKLANYLLDKCAVETEYFNMVINRVKIFWSKPIAEQFYKHLETSNLNRFKYLIFDAQQYEFNERVYEMICPFEHDQLLV